MTETASLPRDNTCHDQSQADTCTGAGNTRLSLVNTLNTIFSLVITLNTIFSLVNTLLQRSEACLAGPESSQSQSNLLEHSYTVSRPNLAKVKHYTNL